MDYFLWARLIRTFPEYVSLGSQEGVQALGVGTAAQTLPPEACGFPSLLFQTVHKSHSLCQVTYYTFRDLRH